MKHALLFFAFCALLGLVLSQVNVNLQVRPDEEAFLNSYDTYVGSRDACYDYYSYAGNGSKCISSASLSEGDNRVDINASGKTLFFHVFKNASYAGPVQKTVFEHAARTTTKNPDFLFSFLASLLVFFIPGAILTGFFRIKSSVEILAVSVALSICVVFLLSFVLSLAGPTDPVLLALSLLLACITFFVLSPKKPRAHALAGFFKPDQKRVEVRGGELKKEYLVALAFILITVGSQALFFSHDSPWSVYYERQTEATYSAGKLPATDSLSYLGRSFTFVPGYPLFKASFAWLANTSPQQLFFIMQVAGNAFLLAAIFFLGHTLKLKPVQNAVLAMFLYSSLFVFGWTVISLLHMYAFALFIVALGLALRGSAASGVIAGVAGLFHASFLPAFPFLFWALQKKTNWKQTLLFSLTAAAVFFLVYSPVISANGMPNEIKKEDWGYFIRGNPINLGTMSAGIMSLAFIPALFLGFRKEKKLGAFVLILIALFLTMSYRLNIFLGLAAAVLFLRTVPIKKSALALLLMLFAASVGMNWYMYYGESLNKPFTAPFEWIGTIPGTQNILAEPFYGHASNYFARKPTLADLYVEYASEEKYDDAMRFIETGDQTLLEKNDTAATATATGKAILNKWNISFVVALHDAHIIRIAEFKYYEKELEYPFLDKVYSNLYFNVFYRQSP